MKLFNDFFVSNLSMINFTIIMMLILYLVLVKLKIIENFTIETFENNIIDFNSLKQLAIIAEKLNKDQTIVIPGDLTVSGKLKVGGENGIMEGDANGIKINKELNLGGDLIGTSVYMTTGANIAGHILNNDDIIVNGALRFSKSGTSTIDPKTNVIAMSKGRLYAKEIIGGKERADYSLSEDKT